MPKLTKKEKEDNKYLFLVELGKKYSKENKETEWEAKLNKTLRELGIKFQTQVPHIYQRKKLYVLDFLLNDYQIVIEADGKQWHSSKQQIRKDNLRTKHLRADGFHIIRLWNSQITRYTNQEIKEIIDNKLKMLKDLKNRK